MYYFAEYFHFSGVLAVVSGGLFLSNRRQSMLNFRSRIEGVNVWNSLVFVLNGFIFMLIGLQLPAITRQLGDTGLSKAIWYGLVISIVLIVTRMLCALAASPFTTLMSRFITVADPHPGWKNPVIVGWSGMRGVVSLAMALSIPLVVGEGKPFPYRNLILFITFIVILVTLVFQGLTLPWVIRKVKPGDKYIGIPDHQQELLIERKTVKASLQFLEQKYREERVENEYLENLFRRLQIDLKSLDQEFEESNGTEEDSSKKYRSIYLELLEHQRQVLNEINRSANVDEELIRKYLSLVDLEEYKIQERQLSVVDATKVGPLRPDRPN
jgi:monovalent cation/hydrogen antiporter